MAASILASTAPGYALRFSDVTEDARISFGYPRSLLSDPPQFCGGVAAGDYDRDGFIDWYATTPTGQPKHLFHNDGDGTFSDRAGVAGVELPGLDACSATFADFDGDGWLDLIVVGIRETAPALLHNRGDSTFADVTASAGITTTRNTFSAAFGDYDRDGDLDLLLSHWGTVLALGESSETLWRNDGAGHFTDVSLPAAVTAALLGGAARAVDHTFTPNFADLDRDGWPDILLASDFGTSRVLQNQRDGTFANTTDRAVITDENGMGAAIADYDGDGNLDWFVSSIWDPNGVSEGAWGISGNRLYRGRGDGTFEDATETAGVRIGYWGWGSTFADLDDDGHIDLFHTNGFGDPQFPRTDEFVTDPSRLFMSNGDGTFTERSAEAGIEDAGLGRGVVAFDYDRDGDLDLLVTNNGGTPRLYRNDGNGNHTLTVRLRGRSPNTEGIGARIQARAGGVTQERLLRAGSNFVSQDPAEAHFGLGAETRADVTVFWPDGRQSKRSAVRADQVLELAEPDLAVTFTDVTVAAGVSYLQRAGPATGMTAPYFQEEFTGGAAAGDYDGDGRVDLFASRLDGPPMLFHNNGDGTFTDVAATSGVSRAIPVGSNAAAWADVDNDGRPDLYVTTWNSPRFHLLMNRGDGSFADEGVERGASLDDGNPHFGQGVAVGDYDRDGFLDIFVAAFRINDDVQNPLDLPSHNRLLRNRGRAKPGHFEDVTVGSGARFDVGVEQVLGVTRFQEAYAPRLVDLDGDQWPDLAITGDSDQSLLFWNNRDGTFTEGRTAAGIGKTGFSDMGSAVADFDGDGLLDWFITDIYQLIPGTGLYLSNRDGNRLYLNNGDRTFTEAGEARGVRNGHWGWGASAFDFDNDGDIDIVHSNGIQESFESEILVREFRDDPMALFENDGQGTFTEVATSRGLTDTGQGKGLLTFDYDDDGDLDVFVVNHGGAPILYRNDGGNTAHRLRLDLVGRSSNRDAIGATVRITPDGNRPTESQLSYVDGGSNFLGQNERTVHFGLAAHGPLVERVDITWPSGIVQTLTGLPVDTRQRVVEPLTQSLANGRLLLISRPGKPRKQLLKVRAADRSITLGAGPGSDDDPVLHGGRLRVATATGDRFDEGYALPASGWRRLGRAAAVTGYRFRSKAGPVRSVVVRAGRAIEITARGAGLRHTLSRDPTPVYVELNVGAVTYQFSFTGAVRFAANRRYAVGDRKRM